MFCARRWSSCLAMAARAGVGSLVVSLVVLGQPAGAASIGLNFTGSSSKGSGDIIPDTMGAVGPNHIVELLNDDYTVYDKTTGQQLQRMSLNIFWSQAILRGPERISVNNTFDPRVVYDPTSDRWYAVSASRENHLFLGASISSDPTFPLADLTRGWKGFALDGDPSAAPNLRWGDFPTLGVNADSISISTTLLSISTTAVQPRGYAIYSIPKADLLGPTPSVANRSQFTFDKPAALGGATTAIQGVLDFGPADGRATLFAANPNFGLQRWDLLNTAESLPNAATLSPPTSIPITPYEVAPPGNQPGNVPDLFNFGGPFIGFDGPVVTDLARFGSNLVQQGTHAWGVHVAKAGERSGLRWYEIDLESNELVQSGTISDSALDLIYPSIAVNPFGDAVIGFTATGEERFPSAYAVVGDTVGGVTTFGSLMELKAGAATFQGVDDRGRNRWGDYSQTVVDPSNPYSFWTFQEFAQPANQWAVQISQIVVLGPVARTEIVGPTAMTAVRDTDSDAVFDNLGDTATAVLGTGAARVGELDPATGSNLVERLVTKFPLPGEPGLGDRLETATLRFYLQQIQGTPAGPLSLLHSTSDNELDRLASDFEDASYLDTQLDLLQPTSAAGAYYELDVTDLVRADYAADGANPLSAFRLQISELAFMEDNISHNYFLGTGAGITNPPRLMLTFIPVPEPPTALMLLSAILTIFLRRRQGILSIQSDRPGKAQRLNPDRIESFSPGLRRSRYPGYTTNSPPDNSAGVAPL